MLEHPMRAFLAVKIPSRFFQVPHELPNLTWHATNLLERNRGFFEAEISRSIDSSRFHQANSRIYGFASPNRFRLANGGWLFSRGERLAAENALLSQKAVGGMS